MQNIYSTLCAYTFKFVFKKLEVHAYATLSALLLCFIHSKSLLPKHF